MKRVLKENNNRKNYYVFLSTPIFNLLYIFYYKSLPVGIVFIIP